MRNLLVLAVAALSPALLSHCSGVLGGGPPSGLAKDCLAMTSGDGPGWNDLDVPVSDLLEPFQGPDVRQSWESAPRGGYVLRTERTDALTHNTIKSAVEFVQAGSRQTKLCGPQRVAVTGILADGKEIVGYDLINTVFTLIGPAAQARQQQGVSGTAPTSSSPRPSGAIPPTNTEPTHYGELTPTPAVRAALASQAAPQPSMQGPSHPASGPNGDAGLSPAYNTCMNSGDAANGVTMALLNCAAAETSRQDARLNQAYKAKMAGLPPDQQQALRASERDWIKSRDATCKAASDEDAGGSLAGVLYAQCVVKQEAGRATFLERSK